MDTAKIASCKIKNSVLVGGGSESGLVDIRILWRVNQRIVCGRSIYVHSQQFNTPLIDCLTDGKVVELGS